MKNIFFNMISKKLKDKYPNKKLQISFVLQNQGKPLEKKSQNSTIDSIFIFNHFCENNF